jgi:hypothetical protein
MKKYLLLTSALFMGAFITRAQDKSSNINFINIESGLNLSKFNFSNSEITAFKNGDYSPSQHQAISIGFELKGDLNLVLGASYDKHQLMGKPIDMSSSRLSYDLNYASASAGLAYNLSIKDKVDLLLGADVAYNYLFAGFQNIGVATYDLSGTDFEMSNLSSSVGVGILYQITDATGIFLKYDWSNTVDLKERDVTIETYKLTSFVYSLGIRFNLAD